MIHSTVASPPEKGRAIALFASARRDGNTGRLIDSIAVSSGIDVIDLAEKDITPYDYNHCNLYDDFVPLMRGLLDYEKLIFVTPIYWYGPSAQMKVFIDRTSDFLDIDSLKDIGRKLRGKTAYIVCTSSSEDADCWFLGAFKSTFDYLGMNYGGHLHANCAGGYDPEKCEQDVREFVSLI